MLKASLAMVFVVFTLLVGLSIIMPTKNQIEDVVKVTCKSLCQ